ncbi:hypothetical protein LguiB_032205 [Lonicera macranthoides]
MPNRFDSHVCLESLIQPRGGVESAGGSGRTLKKKEISIVEASSKIFEIIIPPGAKKLGDDEIQSINTLESLSTTIFLEILGELTERGVGGTSRTVLCNRPTMSEVPSDVLTNILSGLPAKLLLRFSCVSKQWRALIGSNDFIKLHLTRSTETNTNLIIIIKDGDCLYYVNLDLLDNAVRLNPPLNLNK